jgi:hypothetical protein
MENLELESGNFGLEMKFKVLKIILRKIEFLLTVWE